MSKILAICFLPRPVRDPSGKVTPAEREPGFLSMLRQIGESVFRPSFFVNQIDLNCESPNNRTAMDDFSELKISGFYQSSQGIFRSGGWFHFEFIFNQFDELRDFPIVSAIWHNSRDPLRGVAPAAQIMKKLRFLNRTQVYNRADPASQNFSCSDGFSMNSSSVL